MAKGSGIFPVAAALLAAMLSHAPLWAESSASPIIALDQLERGLWQIMVKGEAPRKICIAEMEVLLQLGHGGIACRRFAIANGPTNATVHYTCPASEWGQTTLRVETSQLAQIDTQGIAGGMPFAFTAEARRMGVCQASGARR